MARTNKYASINFNNILDKTHNNTSTTNSIINNPNTKQPPSSSFSSITSPNSTNNNLSTRTHGRMLVLTRPAPKPITTPPLSPLPQHPIPQNQQLSDRTRSQPGPDQISLLPSGSTGTGSPVSSPVLCREKEKEAFPVMGLEKRDKFVPPHLRPGFAGKEERPGVELFKRREVNQRQHQGYYASPDRFREHGWPKSGSGYERMGGGPDVVTAIGPMSSGNRPRSSG
ncbi:hypothetical protein CFOL_v3_19434 [Cephalotus follicularis]|uniref:Uncharacterized protein n=1 Tax=Cephalotus follicularis TaxID=3775 RepID=A0A1Q3C799_CEPFO|nr:hypothetical protein CFOL_v3_19434 [Cephalotus follicularis]